MHSHRHGSNVVVKTYPLVCLPRCIDGEIRRSNDVGVNVRWQDGSALLKPSLAVVYTRTGRRFFEDAALEKSFLERIRDSASGAELWNRLGTDWLCLDCELMPWSAKAQELLQKQYASGTTTLQAGVDVLKIASDRISGLEQVLKKAEDRLGAVEACGREYRQDCWPVKGLADLKLTPFHLLASEGCVHTDKPHTWHTETLADLCKQDTEVLLATHTGLSN